MTVVDDILAKRHVAVCVGSGGVGKTTTAAALALLAATRGKNTLCLTIDPAKRLANALGLERMTVEEQRVSAAHLAQHGIACTGSLTLTMLDPKRTFDDLVTQHAPTPEARRRVLDNRLYQYVSTSLAGTQEYMAMEKLQVVRKDPRFDFVVLDTPPTSHTLDFLAAPERLIEAIDSPAMRWFVDALGGEGKLSLRLVGRGAQALLAGLAKFTGAEFLAAVSEFVSSLNALFGGFRARAGEVASALRSPDVGFIGVTSPEPLAIEETLYFDAKLAEAGMTRDAILANRVHLVAPRRPLDAAGATRELTSVLPAGADAGSFLRKLERAYQDERLLADADRTALDGLRRAIPSQLPLLEIPLEDEDVHDVTALARIAARLGDAQPRGTSRS